MAGNGLEENQTHRGGKRRGNGRVVEASGRRMQRKEPSVVRVMEKSRGKGKDCSKKRKSQLRMRRSWVTQGDFAKENNEVWKRSTKKASRKQPGKDGGSSKNKRGTPG